MHAAPAPDLRSAHEALWGSPAVAVIEAPFGNTTVPLAVTPDKLVKIAPDRYAFIETETNAMAAHAVSGAVSVTYLDWQGRHWRKIGEWREIARNGESGGASLVTEVRRDLGRDPVLLVRGGFLGQGDQTASAVIVRLAAARPIVLGSVPTGADNVGSGEPATHHFTSRLLPGHAGAFLTAAYSGWRGHGEDGPTKPAHFTLSFAIRAGCLALIEPSAPADLEYDPGAQPCTADEGRPSRP